MEKNVKISLIVFSVLFIVCLFLAFVVKNDEIENESIITSVSDTKDLPKTVIIDAGHGDPDGGAVSQNGIKESDINLMIAYKLKDVLEQRGISVILTRENENGIYDEKASSIRQKKKSDLENRVNIANESNADIFISIHLNKINNEKYYGFQTFYKSSNDEGKKLAISIQQSLKKHITKENKREAMKIDNVFIMDNINIPACIVECGFLSNLEEEKLLISDEYQKKLALGICDGIVNYFDDKV